jgi:glutaredoxin
MEGYSESVAAGDFTRPTIVRDPDHPDYLGPILIPLGEIVLFARPGCAVCDRVRAILAARQLFWRELDASSASHLPRREQLVYTSYLRVPILCAAGYAVVGFDESRINEVLDVHEERVARIGARTLGT